MAHNPIQEGSEGWLSARCSGRRSPITMKRFSFGTRMVYFSLIAAISIAFFALQLYIASESGGGGAIFLTVLWGIMALFGIGGIVFTLLTRNRTKK